MAPEHPPLAHSEIASGSAEKSRSRKELLKGGMGACTKQLRTTVDVVPFGTGAGAGFAGDRIWEMEDREWSGFKLKSEFKGLNLKK